MKQFALPFTYSCALVAIIATSPAMAKQITTKANANRTSVIYTYGQYNAQTCGAMAMPKFRIKQVDNGLMKGIKRSFVLKDGPCKGRSIRGIAFSYTPNRGFRGYDKARVILTMPAFTDDTGNRSITLNFTIDVR